MKYKWTMWAEWSFPVLKQVVHIVTG
jgi:hypothetical protein